jgi:hypothetical protein
MERVPRVYVPPPLPKKDARKKAKDEPPPPDVGSDTRSVQAVDYGAGRTFPHVTFRLQPQSRHPGDERAAPVVTAAGAARPGTAGRSRPQHGNEARQGVDAGAAGSVAAADRKNDVVVRERGTCPSLYEVRHVYVCNAACIQVFWCTTSFYTPDKKCCVRSTCMCMHTHTHILYGIFLCAYIYVYIYIYIYIHIYIIVCIWVMHYSPLHAQSCTQKRLFTYATSMLCLYTHTLHACFCICMLCIIVCFTQSLAH